MKYLGLFLPLILATFSMFFMPKLLYKFLNLLANVLHEFLNRD